MLCISATRRCCRVNHTDLISTADQQGVARIVAFLASRVTLGGVADAIASVCGVAALAWLGVYGDQWPRALKHPEADHRSAAACTRARPSWARAVKSLRRPDPPKGALRLRGAGDTDAQGANDNVTCAYWNARELAYASGNTRGADKLLWLGGWLDDEQPDVVFLCEVLGDMASFRLLRGWLRGHGYAARFLPGRGEGRRDGIVAAVRRQSARLSAWCQVAERTLGVAVRHRGEADVRRYVMIHGLSGSADCERQFCTQLNRAKNWAGDGGVVLGDLNHVVCRLWRSLPRTLSASDRALRHLVGWSCTCCARDDDSARANSAARIITCAGRGSPTGWTRYRTQPDGAGVSRWGDGTSHVDMAIEIGGDGAWTLQRIDFADVKLPDGTASPLSDHAIQLVAAPRAAVAATRELRPTAPRMGRADVGNELRAFVADALLDGGEVSHAMLRDVERARLRGTPATDAATAALVDVLNQHAQLAQIETERRRNARRGARGGLATPLRRFRCWRQRLRQARAARADGLDAWSCNHLAIMHPLSGMRRLRDNRGDGWERIISHCRHEMNYAARALHKQRDDDAARAIDGVAQLDKIPEDDVARRLAAAQRILKPKAAVRGKRKDDLQKELRGEQGGGASVDVFREGNSTTGRRVRGTDADAGQVLADCGKGMVDAFDGGSVPDAYAAMCEKFVGGWPELTGADGDEWCLLSELSYPVFRDVVRTMPPKAVGCSGVAVQLLKAASEQVLRRFYEAIVSDLQRDTISERWHTILYVMLEKKSGNQEVLTNRREIALTEHDVKILLHMVRRRCYCRLIGRVARQQVGWLSLIHI